MKTLTERLTDYAGYHRDRRNIATHFVGIPMIVLAIQVLLSRPVVGPGLSPATLITLGAFIFYLSLDLRFGLLMGVLTGLTGWTASLIAAQTTGVWLALGISLFVVGWVIQFIGHYFEGKKPAFVDDLVGLVVGPLFVVAEVVFALGMRAEVLKEIEAKVGPTIIRDMSVKRTA